MHAAAPAQRACRVALFRQATSRSSAAAGTASASEQRRCHSLLPSRRARHEQQHRRRPSAVSTAQSQRRHYQRPPSAPKPVLDIKHMQQNPGLYEQNSLDRNYTAASRNAWRIGELRTERARLQREATEPRQQIKNAEREVQRIKTSRDYSAEGVARVEELVRSLGASRSALSSLEAEEARLEHETQELALALPALSSRHTPSGTEAVQLSQVGPSPSLRRNQTSHVDIGSALGLLDFAGAASTSGWGWYFLKGDAALLEHALVGFALQVLRARGWTLHAAPSAVYAHAAHAAGFAPRDAHGETQTYGLDEGAARAANADVPARVLAATAEVPLAGMHAGRTLDVAQLPLRTAGVSRCFRAEAGARGADTRGLYRVHEFTKVEMFAWTAPEEDGFSSTSSPASKSTDSAVLGTGHFGLPPTLTDTSSTTEETEQPPFNLPPADNAQDAILHEMLHIQQHILTQLGLSFRVLEMPSTDLGAPATRKVDIEAWFPSRGGGEAARTEVEQSEAAEHNTPAEQNSVDPAKPGPERNWGEVTSTSTCGTFQSRRLGVRARRANGSLGWPGTANGTALAVPRIIAALLEVGFEEEAEQRKASSGISAEDQNSKIEAEGKKRKGKKEDEVVLRGRVRVPECLWPWMGDVRYLEGEKRRGGEDV